MKKIAAILLIALLLFNWYGYRVVTNYLQKKADTQLESRLDVNDYDESELIEIRVELNIPYQNSQANFERHSGEIEINGRVYAYVKRKVEDGCLILKCIANTVKQEIKNANNILFAINHGIDQERNSKNSLPGNNIFKTLSAEYDNDFLNYNLKSLPGDEIRSVQSEASFFKSVSLPVTEQPPETSSIPVC